MTHFGDITKIHGADVPPVDAVIGGSPCQGLSIAGRRAGLAHERSALGMEQLRLIKDMRRSPGKPRWMVWAHVPRAFRANKGEDFGAVLHETIRIICPKAPPVSVPQNGWPTSGCIVGDEWSLAWRVLDAQFWGVPQRRRRIALVTDFAGQSAPEILFEREIVSGDSKPGEAPREGRNFRSSCGWHLSSNRKEHYRPIRREPMHRPRTEYRLLPARKRDRPRRDGRLQRQRLEGRCELYAQHNRPPSGMRGIDSGYDTPKRRDSRVRGNCADAANQNGNRRESSATYIWHRKRTGE